MLLTDLTRFVAGFEVEEGKWMEFGGGRDNGETPWQTAKRELYEESSCLFTLDKESLQAQVNSLGLQSLLMSLVLLLKR